MLLRRPGATLSGAFISACAVLLAPQASAGQYTHTDDTTTGSWTAPAYVDVAQVIVEGARGGNGHAIGAGARAGSGGTSFGVSAALDVSAGQVVTFGLGRPGADANGTSGSTAGGTSGFSSGTGGAGNFNTFSYTGGGGGGASLARLDGNTVAIAAGGGGGGGADVWDENFDLTPYGGAGGSADFAGFPWSSDYLNGRDGGRGSDSSGARGGRGAIAATPGTADTVFNASAGVGASGGNGGTNFCSGGGGGAGAAGGGGGDANASITSVGCGGGGSGSSYVDRSKTVTNGATSVSSTGSAYGQVNYIDFTTTTLVDGVAGSAYSASVVATFGASTAPDVWSVSPPLPSGLSLNTSTGAITGTPISSASGTYTITASYSGGLYLLARSSRSFTLIISSAPDPEAGPTNNATSSSAPSSAPALSSSGGPWTLNHGEPVVLIPATNTGGPGIFSISPPLPSGLQLNTANGAISGVPRDVVGEKQYTLTATNDEGSSSVVFSLAVASVSTIEIGKTNSPRGIGDVQFKTRSREFTDEMKSTLLARLDQTSKTAPLTLVSIVPVSEKPGVISLAHRRGTAVRKFLREQGYAVDTQIVLAAAKTPLDLRRVLLFPRVE